MHLPPLFPPHPQLVIREVAVVDVRYVFTYIKDALAKPASTAVAELPRDALQVRGGDGGKCGVWSEVWTPWPSLLVPL